jgi:bis(5'-nucleosidyl)-tetraphosphatase
MADRILSAGVVVVREEGGHWHVLMLRVYNYWDCPKGLVEPGEDPMASARREVREETGLEELDFRWGEDYIETEPYSKNKVARYYIAAAGPGDVKLPVSEALGRPEHHEFRWVGFQAAAELTVPRLQRVLAWAASRLKG